MEDFRRYMKGEDVKPSVRSHGSRYGSDRAQVRNLRDDQSISTFDRGSWLVAGENQ